MKTLLFDKPFYLTVIYTTASCCGGDLIRVFFRWAEMDKSDRAGINSATDYLKT